MSVIKDKLLWLYWYPCRHIIQQMPFSSAYAIDRIAGQVLYVLASHKRNAFKNELHTIFGRDLNPAFTRTAVRRTFVHWCQSEAEMMLYPQMNKKNISIFVGITGLDNLDRAISVGKGVLLLFSHFGANQMIMPAIGYNGYKMNQLSAPPTIWTEKIPNRNFSGMEKKALELRWAHERYLPATHINIFGSLKGALTCLKRNEILGIAIDGGGGRKRVMVDFLGKNAFFSTGAMDIVSRTECTVLPTFIIRSTHGRNRMIIEKPMDTGRFDGDDFIAANTQAFAARLESYVRSYPCHYLHFLSLRTFMESIDGSPFMIKKTVSE